MIDELNGQDLDKNNGQTLWWTKMWMRMNKVHGVRMRMMNKNDG